MPRFFGSHKGVETGPLFIVFAAIVLIVTAALVFDTYNKWSEINDKGRVLNEAKRLAQACDELKLAGDQGSSAELSVTVPDKCSIEVASSAFNVKCSFASGDYIESIQTKAKVSGSSISPGTNKVKIIYSAKGGSASPGTYVIYIS